jgi:hypothetical protein
MFFIICAIDLCEVFHCEKLILSILVGAQKFVHKWILKKFKFYQQID